MVLRKILDHLDGKSTPPCQRSTEEPVRQLVKTRRHTLILRKKSELCAVGTLIILVYACTHGFIEVVVLIKQKPGELPGNCFENRTEELSPCIVSGLVFVFRQQHNVRVDRKSTRLNSSHGYISYAVFCLKKKKHLLKHLAGLGPTATSTAMDSSNMSGRIHKGCSIKPANTDRRITMTSSRRSLASTPQDT